MRLCTYNHFMVPMQMSLRFLDLLQSALLESNGTESHAQDRLVWVALGVVHKRSFLT